MSTAGRVFQAALLIHCAGAAAAASDGKWDAVTFYEENDTFGVFRADKFYTQGMRLVFRRDRDSTWAFAKRLDRLIERKCCGEGTCACNYEPSASLVIGHAMMTPELITSFRNDRGDRPFAGFLYAGILADVVRDGRVRHSFEGDIGFLGPPALAKPAQKGFHVLRKHRIPKGWDFELGTEPQLNFRYSFERRFAWKGILDLTPNVAANLGTLQIYPAAGATLRFGWHLSGFPSTPAPVPAPAPLRRLAPPPSQGVASPGLLDEAEAPGTTHDFEIGVFGGADARYFIRNAFLDGNLLGGSPSDVSGTSHVNDLRYGLTVRYRPLRLTVTQVHRSRQFQPTRDDGRHNFGSLAFEWDPAGGSLLKPGGCWANKDWQIDFGLGTGITRFTESGVRGRTANGPTGRLSLTKGAFEHFTAGVEFVGAVREGGRPNWQGVHRDTFLLAKLLTLGVRPFGGQDPLHFRVGIGSAEAKREFTIDGHPEEHPLSETGRAYMASLEYLFRVGRALSLGVNTTWTHLQVDGSVFGGGDFIASNVTVRWYPLGRWR